ncbi:thiamine-phosphate kinase [Sphingomonas sp. S1-29]|uniref:thiamine-phosphate kinase n=1 Tax=Sphingomonas sp. S1-29 TaxID=2991074 RepID=UPI00223F183C|nr:thiamine-phosphate kinase [Sphingomonas sp. S1-29]UZK68280.1 thiamine-phosphate kinase [Sphingomonas sp. S1-29]
MNESTFLTALRSLPLHAGARDLADDTALLGDLVLTKDLVVEGIHFLPTDPAADIAWKLVAVNLSDLAAKGAVPIGILLGYPLAGDDGWDRGFLEGLREICQTFACPILGGDTVTANGPRTLSLTAIGRATDPPARSGARIGDALWVTGTIGDAAAGLAIAIGEQGPSALLAAYRRPQPRLAEGRALAPQASAMMDVSDGLLIDAARMAQASRCAVMIDLAAVPLSPAYAAHIGTNREARLAAATGGDDYQLLFALPPDATPPVPATRVGSFAQGTGLTLTQAGHPVPLPPRIGYQHG